MITALVLGQIFFQELQIMKFAWNNTIPNLAAWNSNKVEEIDTTEYSSLLSDDTNWQANFNNFDAGAVDNAAEVILVN